MKKLLLLAAAAMSVSTAANAALVPVLQYVTPFDYFGTNNLYLWSYSLTVTGGSDLSSVVSRFAIYDFAGYVPFPQDLITGPNQQLFPTPADWAASVEPQTNTVTQSGGFIPNPIFPDDPAVENLIFTYTGADFDNPGTDPVEVYGFSVLSQFGMTKDGGFSAETIEPDNYASFNQGHTKIPGFSLDPGLLGTPPGPGQGVGDPCVPGIVCIPTTCLPGRVCLTPHDPVTGGVPEPATWAMMILGFGGMGALLRRRRRDALLAA